MWEPATKITLGSSGPLILLTSLACSLKRAWQLNCGALIRTSRIVITGGPCPQYSRITEGPGRERLIKDSSSASCVTDRRVGALDSLIPGRPELSDREDVHECLRAYGDIRCFKSRLNLKTDEARLVDAADYGLVSRPRLWWAE